MMCQASRAHRRLWWRSSTKNPPALLDVINKTKPPLWVWPGFTQSPSGSVPKDRICVWLDEWLDEWMDGCVYWGQWSGSRVHGLYLEDWDVKQMDGWMGEGGTYKGYCWKKVSQNMLTDMWCVLFPTAVMMYSIPATSSILKCFYQDTLLLRVGREEPTLPHLPLLTPIYLQRTSMNATSQSRIRGRPANGDLSHEAVCPEEKMGATAGWGVI